MIYCFVFKKMLFSKKNENQAVLRLYNGSYVKDA